jgi:trehalose 6-phosphate phosphatase
MAAAPPSALARWDEIAGRLAGARPALFLDYDGTLTPIVARPELATLPEPTRQVLRHLAGRWPIAVLSGRGREDVAAKVGLDALVYAGSHGFDIAGPPLPEGGPPLHREVGDGVPEQIERAAHRLQDDLAGLPGVLVEPKRYAVAVHYRLAHDAGLPRIEQAVDDAVAALPGLRKTHGKKVFELRPDLDWDKGKALLWLFETLHLGHSDAVPIYLGDDVTDEDAFAAIAGRGIPILVTAEPRPTAAAYTLRDPDEVREFLTRLAGLDTAA